MQQWIYGSVTLCLTLTHIAFGFRFYIRVQYIENKLLWFWNSCANLIDHSSDCESSCLRWCTLHIVWMCLIGSCIAGEQWIFVFVLRALCNQCIPVVQLLITICMYICIYLMSLIHFHYHWVGIINYYYQHLSFIISCPSPTCWQVSSVIPQLSPYYFASFPLKAL